MAKLEKQANTAVEEKSEVANEENQGHVVPETKKSVNEKGNQSKKKGKLEPLQVIKNASGSNLAVDIWSLGCAVLEMPTTKPPWSQYEGVAAMFKIGNSKELPAIPDHLSDDGKDFVRQCLQRNPYIRSTAAQLLEHPFVKNAAPLERPGLESEPVEPLLGVTAGLRSLGVPFATDPGSSAKKCYTLE